MSGLKSKNYETRLCVNPAGKKANPSARNVWSTSSVPTRTSPSSTNKNLPFYFLESLPQNRVAPLNTRQGKRRRGVRTCGYDALAHAVGGTLNPHQALANT